MIINRELDARPVPEILASHEKLSNPWEVCVTGITSHPTWGEFGEKKEDRFRADEIIRNFERYVREGYSVVVIDRKSSDAFKARLNKIKSLSDNPNQKIEIKEQIEPGYGQARRESFLAASNLPGVKALVQVEFEKPLVDSIPALVRPIINGEAELTISDRQILTNEPISNEPEKEEEKLRGLPRYQARSEAAFNKEVNKLLRKYELLTSNEPDIDFMGNRAWKNVPEINDLFLFKYQLKDSASLQFKGVFKKSIDLLYANKPDNYSGALFFPVIEFLFARYYAKWRFASVKVGYLHPRDQSEFEDNDTRYINTRDAQRENIYSEVVAFIQALAAIGENDSPFDRELMKGDI